jgi:Domain of unknown function (DUF4157)
MSSFAHARRSSGRRVASPADPQELKANRRAAAALHGRPTSERVEVDRRHPDEAQRLTGAPSVGLDLDRRVAPGVASSLAAGFGSSLSHVRLHTDGVAANAASNLGARAFTVGSDIYFGANEFHPGSSSGMSLLAHELAHTLHPGSGAGPVARRQPRDVAEKAQQESSPPYPEEPALLKEAIEAAKAGRLAAGRVLGGGHPKAMALGRDAMVVGPLTSDMGPIYYLYRFGGRDAQNLYLVTRASVIPKDWSAGPTSAELDQAQGGQLLHVSGPEAVAPHGFTSKQQRWEYEFQRDYPGYRDVGGGGDPWGATDEGEMTETGVRVPRVAGHTLLRRPFYERRMAAFFAYQGFIHYAELIEAGHDSAAATIAQTLKQRTGRAVPRDSELDLWEYTGWSRRAVAARQAVELGLLVSEIVIAAGRIVSILRRPRPAIPSTTPDPAPAPAPRPSPVPPSPAAVRVQITERAEAIVAEANVAVDQAVRTRNRAFFEDLGMSDSQVRKVLDPGHGLFKAEYGNAMERATARGFAQDPLLSGSVRHIGSQRGHVAGTGKPDFVIDANVWGQQQFIDVTTRGARAAHVLRDYGKRVLQLVYEIGTFP